jgi:hypothetical protein
MAKLLKLRRGTTTQHGSFTGAEGEVTVDTDKETLVVHDGSTAGGHPVAAEDMANVSSASIAGRLGNDSIATSKIAAGALPSDVTVASANIVDGTIVAGDIGADQINNTHIADNAIQRPMIADNAVNGSKIADSSINSAKILDGAILNADVNASAAIAGTKVSPDFGSQDITTDGNVNLPDNSKIQFGASNDLQIFHDGNHSRIKDTGTGDLVFHSNTVAFRDAADGENVARFNENGDCQLFHDNVLRIQTSSSGATITGNIAVTGTVDGRDVAADGTKLDGIEASATADQTSTEIKTLLASDNLTNAHIANGSIGDAKLANNSVLTDRIINDAVTFAKMQNITSGHFIARNASGVGDPQQLNASEVRTLLNIEDGATADQTGSEILALINSSDIYTSTGAFGISSANNIDFTADSRMAIHINGSEEFRFESDGDFHADGDVIAYSTTVSSDENLKKDIVTVPDSLAKVEALKGVTFTWKKNDNKSAGVIAQDVQKVLPDAVRTVADFDGNDYLAVNYNALISILIESIKELSAKVKVLEAK